MNPPKPHLSKSPALPGGPLGAPLDAPHGALRAAADADDAGAGGDARGRHGADGNGGNGVNDSREGGALSLPAAGLLLALGAVALAAGAAYGLALALPQALSLPVPLATALAAALGVAAAAVPLGWLLWKLARDSEPTAGRGWPADGALPGAAAVAGLPRPLFMELATREWARARRYGSGAALLLVDVDRYSRLCDARGVDAGDAVLAELLRQTAPTLRTADVLTRFAGHQMAVFLAQADATGALDVAERIRERSEQLQVPWQPQPLRLTVSVGVAQLRPAHLHLQALVDDAEDAVGAARQAGGNCVRAAPLEGTRLRTLGSWRDERRAKPKQPGPPG